jgi:hypothetical protein
MKRIFIIASLMLGHLIIYAQLASFTFSGNGTCPTQQNSSPNPLNATIGNFSRTPSLACSPAGNYYSSTGWSLSSTIDESQYIELVITADPGYKLALTHITMLQLRSSTAGPSTVRIAHDNGNNDFSNHYDFTPGTTGATITFDFPDFFSAPGGTVKIRIWGWGAATGGVFRFSNFYINGSVVADSPLQFDYINGRVGLGTTPQYKWEVKLNSNSVASYASPLALNEFTGLHFGYGDQNTQSRKSALVFQKTDANNRGTIMLLNNGEANTNSAGLNDARLVVDFSGNVGIGTTNPQSLLAVNGTITAKKLKITQTGWADYVFEPGYKLLSLSAVEAFIKKNKHLPDVPSVNQVEADGQNVGDMQVLLLKKVEELTLYTIELNKKIAEQEKKIKRLEKKVKKN